MKIFNDKKFIRMEVIRLAQRGRKPKPTAVKQLEGNPGKRQLNANEPKPAARAPSCPKWLEDDAKKEWRRLAKQMEQLGILTEVDMAAFAGYCQAYARWKEAEEFISIAQQYMKQMSKFCEQFGLTPASRSRIVTDRGNDSSDDAMEQLLSLGGEKK